MADVGVTVNASEHVAPRLKRKHLVHDFPMAMETRILCHASVSRLDLNRVMEVFKRESEGMKESVVGLGCPFPNEVVGQMAIVTDGHTLMTRFLPRVVVVLHDMTVSTRLRIVAQVTGPLPIAKRKRSQPKEAPSMTLNMTASNPIQRVTRKRGRFIRQLDVKGVIRGLSPFSVRRGW